VTSTTTTRPPRRQTLVISESTLRGWLNWWNACAAGDQRERSVGEWHRRCIAFYPFNIRYAGPVLSSAGLYQHCCSQVGTSSFCNMRGKLMRNRSRAVGNIE
jgi:hypothetical protein